MENGMLTPTRACIRCPCVSRALAKYCFGYLISDTVYYDTENVVCPNNLLNENSIASNGHKKSGTFIPLLYPIDSVVYSPEASSTFLDSLYLPVFLSTSRSFTLITSFSLSTPSIVSRRLFEISEMWSRPCLPGMNSTNAP